MAATIHNSFVAAAAEAGALDAAALPALSESIAVESEPRAAAAVLVARGLLTRWQADQLLAGRRVLTIGPYGLLEPRPANPLGESYVARHRQLDRRVELQRVSRDLDRQSVLRRRFLERATAIARLDHPHLVHVYDVDRDEESYYIVSEHFSGAPLDAPSPPLAGDPRRAVRICTQLVAALRYAHEQGVVHGDVGPESIFVDGAGVAKLGRLATAMLAGEVERLEDPSLLEMQHTPLDDWNQLGRTLFDWTATVSQESRWKQRLRAVLDQLIRMRQVESELAPICDNLQRLAARLAAEDAAQAAAAAHPSALPDGVLVPAGRRLLRLVAAAAGVLVVAAVLGGMWWGRRGNSDRGTSTARRERPAGAAQPAAKENAASSKVSPSPPVGLPEDSEFERGAIPDSLLTDAGGRSEAAPPPAAAAAQLETPPAATVTDSAAANSAAAAAATDPPAPAADAPVPARDSSVAETPPAAGSSTPVESAASVAAAPPAALEGAAPAAAQVSAPPTSAAAQEQVIEVIAEVGDESAPAAATAAAATPAAATPGAGGEGLPPPFASFPAAIGLPPIGDDPQPVTLGRVQTGAQYLLAAELTCDNALTRRIKFELVRGQGEENQIWRLHATRPGQPAVEIGRFWLEEDAFRFQWEPSAAEDAQFNFVRNGLLRLETRNEFRWIPLRAPVAIGELRVTAERPQTDAEFDIDWLPIDGKNLSAELVSIEGVQRLDGDSEFLFNYQPVERTMTTRDPLIVFLTQKADRHLFLEVAARFGRKARLEAALKVVYRPKPRAYSEKHYGELEGYYQSLASAVDMQLKQVSAIVPVDGQKTKHADEVKRLKNELEAAQLRVSDLQQEHLRIGYVLDKPIRLRVYCTSGDFQIDLATWDGQPHAAAPVSAAEK